MEPVSDMSKAWEWRFSPIEVWIVLLLVGVVLVGVQGLAAVGVPAGAVETVDHSVALDLVDERIERIRLDPMFSQIPSRYSGTEAVIEGWPGFVRETRIAAKRDSTVAGVLDWLTVTVTVRGPSRSDPVSRTVTIGGP